VREAIVDGDRHRRKNGSCRGKQEESKKFNVKEHESGFLQRGRKGRRKRGRGGGMGRVNGGNGISNSKGRPGGKGLGWRNARRQRGKIRRKQFVRQWWALAQMWFVGKKVLVKYGGCARGSVVRALAECMVSIATKHAAGETTRIGALKVGGGVDGKDRSLRGGGRLTPLQSLLSRGYESASEARDMVGMRRLRKANGDGSRKNSGVGNVLQFPINSLGDQFLLVAKQSVLADGSDANTTESFKLGGASTKGGNIRGQIGGVSVEGVLKFAG
jgi:hypothetical protein